MKAQPLGIWTAYRVVNGGSGKTRRNAVCDLKGRCAGGHFANGSIRKVYGNGQRAHREFNSNGAAVKKMQPTLRG